MFEYKDGWIISDNEFSYDNEYTKASVYAMCNGYMGNRGTLEEMSAERGLYVGNYVNGIYDAPGNMLREREIVNIQDWCSIRLQVDGFPFDLTTGEIIEARRWMDLREAVLHRSIKWRSPNGKAIKLVTERFVSITEIHCGFIKWNLWADDDCEVTVESGLDSRVTNIHKDHFKKCLSASEEGCLYLETETRELGYHIGVACRDSLDVSNGTKLKRRVVKKSKYIFNYYSASLKKGDFVSIQKTAAIFTTRDVGDEVRNNCKKELKRVSKPGYEYYRAKHLKRWNELWNEADMAIEGDEKAQIGVRFSIYHLLNSAPYHSSDVSYPARSLSGQDHRGSIFWDTEIFIAPFFTYSLPEVTRNMLMYRYKTLDAAKRKASGLGYEGAYYAWESHETGDEKCHSRVFRYADTGRFMVNHFRDAQIHVSADIAYCINQYYSTSGDMEFLLEYGAEMLFEIARFFASRVQFDKRKSAYVIKGVLGPDEYHEMVDNNAYTNALAKESIMIALKILELIRTVNRKAYDAIAKKILLDTKEIEKWKDTANKLLIPEPDKETRVIEQFSGYYKLEHCSVKEALSRKTKPDEYLGGVDGICSRTQIIKQADVIMLLYLLRDRYPDSVKKANWEFYEPRTEHGSSLSTMAYALVASDIGMLDWSYKYFLHTAFMDLEAKGVYRNHGVHPCSLAGAWLAVINGFCGITPKEEYIEWRMPHMPRHWKKIKFRLKWHGAAIVFVYEEGKFTAALEEGGKNTEVCFRVNGENLSLTPNNKITVS